jgi:Na+-driven multidrug efflux pump
LIFGYGPFPELGIQGAAIASGVSWFGALLCSLYLLIKREKLLSLPNFSYIIADWKQVLKIGTPAGISTAMTPISGAVLMMLLANHGTAAVAAYGAAQRIESLLLLVVMSLTSALTPFMAQNLGAKNYERSFEAMFMSMRFSLVFQFFIFIMMIPLSIPIAALFGREEAVNDLIWLYLIIVPFSYGFQGIIMLLVSSLNAMHQPLQAFYWSFMRLFIFTLPAAWIGSWLYGIQGLFAGVLIGNMVGGVCGYLYALRLRREMLALSVEC